MAGLSRRLIDTPFTPAMGFVLIGLLVGPFVLGDVKVSPTVRGAASTARIGSPRSVAPTERGDPDKRRAAGVPLAVVAVVGLGIAFRLPANPLTAAGCRRPSRPHGHAVVGVGGADPRMRCPAVGALSIGG